MEAKKVWLIILTILIVGPLIFVGSCFPLGLLALNNNNTELIGAIVVGIILAITICTLIIRKIVRSK